MKLGVFDSGKGGAAMAERLQMLLPDAEIIVVDDHTHVPYGSRTNNEIFTFTAAAIQPLLNAHVDAIIIACNTATTVAIKALRERYPTQVFIGIEPMIKPAAALTRSGHIAVLATPVTLRSSRYHELKTLWAPNVIIDEPNCDTWASLIETDQAHLVPIEETVSSLIKNGADVIVLACTHYHWLKERAVVAANGHAAILEPSDTIKERITTLLDR